MEKIRIGCQTYTWEMLGDAWKGSVDDMLDIIKESGYGGVEITNTMIGEYFDALDEFAKALNEHGLEFPAMGFVPRYGWTDSARVEEELLHARKGVDFVSRFPGCRLELAGGSTASRNGFEEKFDTMCYLYGEVAAYAVQKNVSVDIHPHSHAGSIIESAREYELLMTGTDPALLGWCPDTGHIIRGGLNLLETLKAYGDRIGHIHLKDVDSEGRWKMMGRGVCDFKKTFQLLEDIRYSGWVIAEEESDTARRDQKKAVSDDRHYLRLIGY